MVTVIDVCIIIITIAVLSLIIPLTFLLQDVRRMRSTTENVMIKLEKELTPLISNLKNITNDLSSISSMARSQIEQVDLTATTLNKDVKTIVEQWTRTAYLLHDVVDESAVDIAAFLRGISRGVKFFFNNGRAIK
jgi:CBS domain containing-hemolysin-like protein